MRGFNLALRLLWREGRSGELTLLALALMIAVTSSTAIALFADRLQRTMVEQTADFLAADLVVTSPETQPASWLAKASQLHLQAAQTADFSSVLLEHDEMLLASVKAVSGTYPLRGYLKITGADDLQEQVVRQGPKSGQAWVEKRVLSALKLKLGDSLTVGEKPLVVSQILTYETDKQGDFYSFSPRVMINDADLAATGVIQPGSHVHYFFQYKGDAPNLQAFNRWLKPQLNPSQRILDIHKDRPELGSALSRAERYLGLSSIVVILISGVAIAMATRRYTERHFNATAILRCLGLKQRDILWLYGCQFIFLGVSASGVGCVLGWFAQEGLFRLLHDLMPQPLANPSGLALCFGFIVGMVVLLAFALPPLLRLKQVSPLRVLRRELTPLPTSAWLVYGLALAVTAVFIGQYAGDIKMAVTILGGGLALLGLLGGVVHGLLWLLAKLLPSLGLAWRFGLQGLLRDSRASVSQILAFSITLAAMVLSFAVRNHLLDNWQKQLPDNAPNHFALNIFPGQQVAFQHDMVQAGIRHSQFYPVVKGRLVAINNVPVQQVASKDSQGEGAIRRELSLTWTERMPEENRVTQGRWWQTGRLGQVSVEQKLADSLKIKLHDQLTFTVGSQQILAEVTSLRALDWDTMRPNFYMVFSPGTLDAYPSTVMTSFYLPETQKAALNALVKKYPATTILEVDQIVRQFKAILSQLTQAINFLLYFSLLAGFTVLFAAVYATLDERRREAAIIRTLGASRALLTKIQVVEFGLLGLLAGVVTVVMSEVLLYTLYTRMMHMAYTPMYALWLLVPVVGSLCVGLAGYSGIRRVVNQSPATVLREL